MCGRRNVQVAVGVGSTFSFALPSMIDVMAVPHLPSGVIPVSEREFVSAA
ncbi:MAG: hypothetical protein ABIT20_21765 [Gemmatimonadaceae bacterium]